MTNEAKTRDDFTVLSSHRFINILILLTGFLIFLFVPLFILTPGQSKQIFNNGRELQIAFDIAKLIAIFYLMCAVIYWGMCLIKLREVAAALFIYLFSWVALSGFLFSLTTNNGMFEVVSSPVHIINLGIVVVLSTTLTALWGSKYAKTVSVFMATFLVIAILPTIPRALSQFEAQVGDTQTLKLSDDHNLLVIGMDGIPGHIIADIFKEDPEFAAEFKDFTFYENVASTSPATEASLMGIIYGNHNFKNWVEEPRLDWTKLYFNNTEKFDFYSLDKFNIYNNEGTRLSAGRYGVKEQRIELFELYKFVAVRLFPEVGSNIIQIIEHNLFENNARKFFWTTEGYDTVLNSVSAGGNKPTIFFAHFAFTHWPTSIDENCIDRKRDRQWMTENKNLNGVVKSSVCGVKKYKELLARLKSLNVYDNTTIILMSDHGKLTRYYDEAPHNLEINGHEDFGFDRYQPLLMIKPAQTQNANIAYSDRFVLLDDLAQTTCYLMSPSQSCENTPGVNILDTDDIAPDDFYIHVVQNSGSRWYLGDHNAVRLSRNIPLEQAMRQSGEIELIERQNR